MFKLPVLVAAITGTTAGLFGALLVSAHPAPAPAPASPTHTRGPIEVVREVRTVERVIPTTAEAAADADADADANAADATDNATPPPARERFQHELEVHARSARDPAWADAAQASLGTELGALAKAAGFAVRDVDCRARTCAAELEWPSFGAAQQSWEAVLHMPNRLACGTGVLLEPPADAASAYRTRVIYHCPRPEAAP